MVGKPKKQLLIIGDSCAVPRKEVPYESTYCSILKRSQNEYDVINNSIYGNNVRNVYENRFKFYSSYKPEVLVIHLGIVDSYPRPYPHSPMILKFNKFQAKFDRLLKNLKLYFKLGDLFNFKITSKKDYYSFLKEIISDINPKKVIIIGLIKPKKVLLKSNIYSKEANDYNNLLIKLSKEVDGFFIPMNHLDEDYTIWDGFHLSEKASYYISDKIVDALKK